MVKSILLVSFFVFIAWVLLQIHEKLDSDEKQEKRKKITRQIARKSTQRIAMPYVRNEPFLTTHEARYYRVLREVLRHPTDPHGADQAIVLIKVRVADIVKVKSGIERSENNSAFNRIKSKHVDFVLLDPAELEVLCVIELDDASHNAKKVQERDALVDAVYGAAGVPILHVPAKRSYVKEDVARMIREAMGR